MVATFAPQEAASAAGWRQPVITFAHHQAAGSPTGCPGRMIDRKLMHIAFHAPYGLDPARPAPPSQPRKPMTKDVQDLSKHTPMMGGDS